MNQNIDIVTQEDYEILTNTPPFVTGSVKVFGIPFAFSDSIGFLHSLQEIFIDNVYRFSARNSAPRIIDAGANVGLSVLYFKLMYPDCRILAYEPDGEIFDMLQRNVGHFEGVELRRAAAWTEETYLQFYSEGSLAGSTEIDFLNRGNVSTVRAERLKTELQKEATDFLKIDIEGAENEVIFDIKEELTRVHHLFFEYHSVLGKPQRLGGLLNVVQEAGFRYVLSGAHGPRFPFVETVSRGFDAQVNVSCFRPASALEASNSAPNLTNAVG